MRIKSIDVFRGFSVFVMVFFNTMSNFSDVPDYFLHAPMGSLTIVDMIAPFFLFIVGICIYISFSRRTSSQSRKEIMVHFLRRGIFVIILGLLLDMMYDRVLFTWGVLESIGLSIIFTSLFIQYRIRWRIAIALSLSLIYFVLISITSFVEMVEALPHGSIPGVISWSIITILGTVIGEKIISLKDKEILIIYLLKFGILFCAIGYLASLITPFNKSIVSSSYSIFSTGLSSVFFAFFYFLVEMKGIGLNIFKDLGINALFGFIYQYLVSFIIVFYQMGRILFFPLGVTISLIAAVFCWAIIKVLNQRNLYLKL